MRSHVFYPIAKGTPGKITLLIIALIFGFNILRAERTISGYVSDASDGSPLVGATIILKGTNTVTVTDPNGLYQIKIPDKNAILVFSFIGYNNKEVKVSNSDTLNVALVANTSTIDEVRVIGYGTVKRNDVTAAISQCVSNPNKRLFKSRQVFEQNFNPSIEEYATIKANRFLLITSNPLSTFSIDVDRASYANVRRFIGQGQVPPADAVRIEELINYFDYDYPQPTDEHPLSVTTQYTDCPWQEGHKLLHIGLQGKKIPTDKLPPANLVFLIDVSGSMSSPNKLPLVKSAFKLLTNNLRGTDRVAIVVYAGAAGLVLPSTKGSDKNKIIEALEALEAGGSTAGCEGIELAYKVAKENYLFEGNNRVILATDGDFNVGISNNNELERFIAEKRKEGIFLTCLGFGMGNYKDSKMETLADKGNGNYAYIDDMIEANKVFVNEFGGTLFTIAKDVKVQVEFNPAEVQAYRLIGYENRMLNDEDFKDDSKDAGEMGAGHTVTALYEIIPRGVKSQFMPEVDELKYRKTKPEETNNPGEVATVKFRYKQPEGKKSIEMVHPISSRSLPFEKASENCRFAASVAMFGMLLTNSEFKGKASFSTVADLANQAKGADREGYRGEFVRLVKTCENMGLQAEK